MFVTLRSALKTGRFGVLFALADSVNVHHGNSWQRAAG